MNSEIKIEIVSEKEAEEIKKSFKEKFLLSWKEYKAENNEWIKLITSKDYSLSSNMIHMYERMAISKETNFNSALNVLKNKDTVYFMTENEDYPECAGVKIDWVEYRGKIFKASAKDLAFLIEKEWKLYQENENAKLILPLDLYVFDERMKKAVVFSEEIAYYDEETENGEVEVETRLCFSCKSRIAKG